MERTCQYCFDLLPNEITHRQVKFGTGTRCKYVICPICHGRGVLPAAFEGWQNCWCRAPHAVNNKQIGG